jgi:hypothetical protein
LAKAAAVALLALAFMVSGCGGNGVDADATVSVYATAPLCAEAQREASQRSDEGVAPKVRVVCLTSVESGAGADLSRAGANARRATEDSTSVAFLEAPGPAAEFTQSIVEAADVAWVETTSGSSAMRRVVDALQEEGSTPRQAVLDEVG